MSPNDQGPPTADCRQRVAANLRMPPNPLGLLFNTFTTPFLHCQPPVGGPRSSVLGRRSAVGGRWAAVGGRWSAVLLLLLLSACSGQMGDQPRYEPLEPSNFFTDGQSARHLVPGTVARGQLQEDTFLYTGQLDQGAQGTGGDAGGAAPSTNGSSGSAQTGQDEPGTEGEGQPGSDQSGATQGGTTDGGTQQNEGSQTNADQPSTDQQGGATGSTAPGNDNQGQPNQPGGGQGEPGTTAQGPDLFPFPITREVVERGRERYNIYCAPCHDRVGTGEGLIVRRGYSRPPSFHTEQLRAAPASHFYDVITNGWGAMPSYAGQVPVRDRWAITSYIRALQLSQNATLEDVPADQRGNIAPEGELEMDGTIEGTEAAPAEGGHGAEPSGEGSEAPPSNEAPGTEHEGSSNGASPGSEGSGATP
jgi:mono/diheme cytochrome c family protein